VKFGLGRHRAYARRRQWEPESGLHDHLRRGSDPV